MQFLTSLMNMLIPTAYADTTASVPQQPSNLPLITMLVVFFLFMYFAMWRPQSKRAKEHRELINSLSKGDEVVTAGGILGRVAKVGETYVTLAINETTDMVMQKSSITSVLPKGTLKSL